MLVTIQTAFCSPPDAGMKASILQAPRPQLEKPLFTMFGHCLTSAGPGIGTFAGCLFVEQAAKQKSVRGASHPLGLEADCFYRTAQCTTPPSGHAYLPNCGHLENPALKDNHKVAYVSLITASDTTSLI